MRAGENYPLLMFLVHAPWFAKKMLAFLQSKRTGWQQTKNEILSILIMVTSNVKNFKCALQQINTLCFRSM